MAPIWILFLGVVGGLFMAVNGFLLVFFPGSFVRFHDWYTPGDYISKSAQWKKDVRKWEFRFVGALLLCFGAFFMVSLMGKMLLQISLL